MVRVPWCLRVPTRRDGAVPAAHGAVDAGQAHQPRHLVPSEVQARPAGCVPELENPIDAPARLPDPAQFIGRVSVPRLRTGGAETAGAVGVVG